VKPKLLDLFCCGGGASRGYAAAGFDVVGVDIEEQPNYPFPFVKADALEYVAEHGHKYDAIHASPPCQGYSPHVSSNDSQWVPTKGKSEPKLIEPLRGLLAATGKPYVIENVVGARHELRANLMLCGSMFGLPLARHRLFESNVFLEQPEHVTCRGIAKRFALERGWEYRDMSVTGKGRRAGTADRWKEILGIPASEQLTQHQLAECIPPAYTEHIGRALRSYTNNGANF
jgi:DNA (cytosine-5)-methyltransferase 1